MVKYKATASTNVKSQYFYEGMFFMSARGRFMSGQSRLDVRMPGFLDGRAFGRPDVQASGRPDAWTPGRLSPPGRFINTEAEMATGGSSTNQFMTIVFCQ